jgi:hypothetical protein
MVVINPPKVIAFIDENLDARKVGILSLVRPAVVQQILSRIRERLSFWDEIKWTKTSRLREEAYTEIIDFFFNFKGLRLNVVDIDSHQDAAVVNGLSRLQPFCSGFNGIFIDWHSTPVGYNFERRLEDRFNCGCVMRLDSKSNDLLQLTDLMLNLEVYSHDTSNISSQRKLALIKHFEEAKKNSILPKIFPL